MSQTITSRLAQYAAFVILRVRIFTRRIAAQIAAATKPGETVLEIGSGWKDAIGKYYFSAEQYFNGCNVTFIKSDWRADYGHRVIDITKFTEENAYNHILCFHVLDDIYEWEQALRNLYRAVKPGGFLHLIVPAYTLLDLPADLFRFTERLLRECAQRNNFTIDTVVRHGPARYPFAYYVRFKK